MDRQAAAVINFNVTKQTQSPEIRRQGLIQALVHYR